jgi:hypothetical protein
MFVRSVPRRRLFAAVAGLGAGALATTAHAFRQEPASAPVMRAVAARCRAESLHAELVADVRTALADHPGVNIDASAVRAALDRALTCPHCGCRFTGEDLRARP